MKIASGAVLVQGQIAAVEGARSSAATDRVSLSVVAADHAAGLAAVSQALQYGTCLVDPERIAEEILAHADVTTRIRALLAYAVE